MAISMSDLAIDLDLYHSGHLNDTETLTLEAELDQMGATELLTPSAWAAQTAGGAGYRPQIELTTHERQAVEDALSLDGIATVRRPAEQIVARIVGVINHERASDDFEAMRAGAS